MKRLFLKEGYHSILNLMETEQAIKFVKDRFEFELANSLSLTRVSAPLFVLPSTGLNDQLNGIEGRVSFHMKSIEEPVEIVQSLAKWKRSALARYQFQTGTGLYTDMNAIRKDEELDSLHSAYVDQWDWEKIIDKKQRCKEYLIDTVKKIYGVFLKVEKMLEEQYPQLKATSPKDIYFLTTRELEELYPSLSPQERERLICKAHGAVFLMEIGKKLSSGIPHDGRAADYDDWELNGDILLYYEPLDIAFEISSMGIRVDENSIVKQLKEKNELDKLSNPYVQGILNKELPYTIGGGIGQSRLCMYLLRKIHIGEVQASLWPEDDCRLLEQLDIHLL